MADMADILSCQTQTLGVDGKENSSHSLENSLAKANSKPADVAEKKKIACNKKSCYQDEEARRFSSN